jgi:hypothetical protein
LPHVQEVIYPLIPRAELKDRINDAIQEPLDLDSRLWEVQTCTGFPVGQSGAIPLANSTQNNNSNSGEDNDVESLLFFRAHHCMADGVSLGALFGDLMDEGPEFQDKLTQAIQQFKAKRKKVPWWKRLIIFLYYWCWGTVRAICYQMYLYLASWSSRAANPWTVLRQSYSERKGLKPGEDVWEQRTLSWAEVAPLKEVKIVAEYYSRKTKSRVTINDVFCSCVSAAVVKQLQYHRAVNPMLKSKLELPYMNLVIPVHLHGGVLLPGQSMGNKIGAMVSRVPAEAGNNSTTLTSPGENAQSRLMQVSKVLSERKQTPAAVLSYFMASFMGYWMSGTSPSSLEMDTDESSSSWTPWLFEKAHANASVVVTNVRGPDQLMHLGGRPVQATLGFLPLPPGIPIGIVVSSYNQTVSLTVTAEPWAVPDADQFLEWVANEYQNLKSQVDGKV